MAECNNRKIQARRVIELAAMLTDRIAGSEPIPGSKATRADFAAYAAILRNEMSIAYASGNLRDFQSGLPNIPHLREAVIKRLVYPLGEISPKIPGIALTMTPTEDGWIGFFVGESYVRRVKVDKKDVQKEDIEYSKKIIDGWKKSK